MQTMTSEDAGRRSARAVTGGEIYECGDGVPAAIVNPKSGSTAMLEYEPIGLDTTQDRASRTLRGASIALTVVGQFVVATMILAGTDPITGIFAAAAVVVCSLTLIMAEVASRKL